MLCLGFLVYPLNSARFIDYLAIPLVLAATVRVLQFDYQGLDHLLYGLDGFDFASGIIIVAATLEMARRAVGPVMLVVGLVFILYGAFGNLLPDVLASRGFSFERLVRFHVYSNAGLFGAPIGIAAGAVFSFVLFGAFLQVTGAGKLMIDLSFAVAGKYRGGPAKASVIASAAMGSISGSAIANTVTTGSLTIPMMKQLSQRYRRRNSLKPPEHQKDHKHKATLTVRQNNTQQRPPCRARRPNQWLPEGQPMFAQG